MARKGFWAYERSAARYAMVRQTLGDPDLFKLKYREKIKEAIVEVITGGLGKKDADADIKNKSQQIPEADRSKFIETVETELLDLHEGNFARYWIRPAEFKEWKEIWDKQDHQLFAWSWLILSDTSTGL